jgi:hypothetical protein
MSGSEWSAAGMVIEKGPEISEVAGFYGMYALSISHKEKGGTLKLPITFRGF